MKINAKIFAAFCGIAFTFIAFEAGAQQKYTVSGYVTDVQSGEPLIGVAVIDVSSGQGCVTGNSGFYSIRMNEGDHTLLVSYLAYEERNETVKLNSNISLNIGIVASSEILSASTVTASRSDAGVLGTQMSAIEVPLNQIKAIPAIGGEVDVLKALQLLPGVQSGTEGMTGLYVRGGGADENLLLMDGVPLYNVSHMLGCFSVFNADAVKNVTLYKGSFPARFGGHLSSVIDVRMNDGNDKEIHGNASIGLISTKFNLEGPIVKGRTTFNVSARRTYLDLLSKPLLWYGNKEAVYDKNNYSKYDGGYNFYDINAKITHKFRNYDRLSLNFYTGDDTASVGEESFSRYNLSTIDPNTGTGADSDTDRFSKEKYGVTWKWGNMVTSLRWNHEVKPDLYMSASLSYTQYRSKLGVGISEYSSKLQGKNEFDIYSSSADVNYNSLVNDACSSVDFDWRPSTLHDVKFGESYTFHSFKPGVLSMFQEYYGSEDPSNNASLNQKFGDQALKSHELAIYCEDNWTVTPWLKANLGLHASMYSVNGKNYFSAEPRISARALIVEGLSAKISYSEMSQYIHLLCNSNLSMPSDLWVPVTRNIKPMRSRQAAAGMFYELGGYEFSLEGYWKNMDNVLEYKDGASYLGTSTGWEDKVCMGRGWSYGLEFLIQKKVGKTSGWIGYTLAKSMRQFDRPGMTINDGNPFPAKYDRRHDLSATVSHVFSKRFDMSASFIFASGNCGTLSMEDFYMKDLMESSGQSASYIPGRNNYRMPAYNRLDLGMNFHKKKKHGTATWNISVYNAYNHNNPLLVVSGWHEQWDEESNTDKGYPVLKQISLFPIIPSVSYSYKF